MQLVYRLAFILFGVLFIWQVFLPAIQNKPVLPWFRRRKLEDKIKDLNEEEELAHMLEKIDLLQARIAERKKKQQSSVDNSTDTETKGNS